MPVWEQFHKSKTAVVSDNLRTVAKRYGIASWYSYSGRLGDQFSAAYKESTHQFRLRNAVYEAMCSCGQRYIGESNRNLKVRVAEHKSVHSNSSLSNHLRIGYAHSLLANRTQTIIREKQQTHRKLLESLIMLHNPNNLCNTGPSLDVPDLWFGCQHRLRSALAD